MGSTAGKLLRTILAALAVLAALAPPTRGQPAPPGTRRKFDPTQGQGRGPVPIPLRVLRPTPGPGSPTVAGTFSLARDSDAEQWLKKAAAAGDRQEWKLAIDTLWRVIDQYPDAIVSTDGKSASSAAERAWSLLRSWPPAALETYRTLFEPEAARLLSEAEQRGDA